MTGTDSGKILDIAVKGSAAISSARKINKAMNMARMASYLAFAIVVLFNVLGIFNAFKQ